MVRNTFNADFPVMLSYPDEKMRRARTLLEKGNKKRRNSETKEEKGKQERRIIGK
jgi:hypothetical protein